MKLKGEIELARKQMKSDIRPSGPDPAVTDLERERETTKKIYEDLLATLKRSELSTQMEVQDKAGAFRILDPAIVPTRPLTPDMIKMIILSALAGLAAGTGLILLADALDSSVKSVESLKKMGLPVLAVISTIRTTEELAITRRRDRTVYAIAGLYLGALLALALVESTGQGYIDRFVKEAKAEINNTIKRVSLR